MLRINRTWWKTEDKPSRIFFTATNRHTFLSTGRLDTLHEAPPKLELVIENPPKGMVKQIRKSKRFRFEILQGALSTVYTNYVLDRESFDADNQTIYRANFRPELRTTRVYVLARRNGVPKRPARPRKPRKSNRRVRRTKSY